MTKAQAKEVIEMMFKDKTDIPKEDVFKVIDMIDEVGIKTIEYPITYPTYPWTWKDNVVYCGNAQPKVTLNLEGTI